MTGNPGRPWDQLEVGGDSKRCAGFPLWRLSGETKPDLALRLLLPSRSGFHPLNRFGRNRRGP